MSCTAGGPAASDLAPAALIGEQRPRERRAPVAFVAEDNAAFKKRQAAVEAATGEAAASVATKPLGSQTPNSAAAKGATAGEYTNSVNVTLV